MFDLGWPELMLIMVVALIVIGPKELPNAIPYRDVCGPQTAFGRARFSVWP